MPANNTLDSKDLGKIVRFKIAPEHIRDYLKRLGPNRKTDEYRGGHAQIAHPGIVIARLWGDAKMDCFLLWASPIYNDGNGRKRIDVGFGVCMGEADVNRIEYGDDHIPMFDAASIEGNMVTEKYFKKVEIFRGTDDQTYSTVMSKWLDVADIPRYPGLCCFFIRGLKLWKFPEKAVPHVRTVGVRNVSLDLYEEEYFSSTSSVSGIKSLIGYDNKIFAIGNLNVAGYIDLNDNSWNVIDGIGTIVPFQNGLSVMDGVLYGGSNTGLYKYNDDTTWTLVDAVNVRGLDTSINDDELLYSHSSGTNEMSIYDGSSIIGYGNLPIGTNPASCRHLGSNEMLYSSSIFKLYHYDETPSVCAPENWCEIYNAAGNILNFINFNNEFWLTKTVAGGAGAQLTLDQLGNIFTKTVTVTGSPLSCYALCVFNNKIHTGIVNTGTDGGYIYRFNSVTEIFTQLPRPSGVPTDTTVSVTCCKKYEGGLYVGSNKGIWKQGDV